MITPNTITSWKCLINKISKMLLLAAFGGELQQAAVDKLVINQASYVDFFSQVSYTMRLFTG
jgi:hypothetical protein